jgi:phenylacetate-CoA ligase
LSLATVIDLYRSRKNLFLDPKEIERVQVKKLRRLLAFAYDNVPFYHEKLRGVGIKPTDVQKLEDIQKIPLTTKTEIQSTPLNSMVARNVNVEECVKSRTSGSTGLSVTTLASRETDRFNGTMVYRAYFKNGMRLRDKMVVVKDLSAHPVQYRSWVEHFGLMKTRYISVFDDPRGQAKFFNSEKPDLIESYPSSLAIIADFYEDIVTAKPHLVFTLGEFLDKRSRETITRVFQTELYDYYASSEIGLISWECSQHSKYHTNADNVLLEFLGEDGEALAVEETGEIVCTNLFNYEMPLIRYNHEDMGAAVAGSCSCGIKLPLMRIEGGKKDDFLLSVDGRVIPPTIFFPYPFESFENIRQFKVIQEKREMLRIQLVTDAQLHPGIFDKAKKEIQRVFGKDMQVEFEIVPQLAKDSGGKLRKVVSKI